MWERNGRFRTNAVFYNVQNGKLVRVYIDLMKGPVNLYFFLRGGEYLNVVD